jgi:hypothetical protein
MNKKIVKYAIKLTDGKYAWCCYDYGEAYAEVYSTDILKKLTCGIIKKKYMRNLKQ